MAAKEHLILFHILLLWRLTFSESYALPRGKEKFFSLPFCIIRRHNGFMKWTVFFSELCLIEREGFLFEPFEFSLD